MDERNQNMKTKRDRGINVRMKEVRRKHFRTSNAESKQVIPKPSNKGRNKEMKLIVGPFPKERAESKALSNRPKNIPIIGKQVIRG